MKRIAISWISRTCIALVATLLALGAVADEIVAPPAQTSGDIRYRSGGVGEGEIQAMKALFDSYPLALTFTARIGDHDAYITDVGVTILRADGAPQLDLIVEGPFLLVDLPAGKYSISAHYANSSKTQTVNIVAGVHRRLVFAWPQTQPE